ncbi:hypothetical protein FHS15_002484 [Paenibacillus castaneae]|nr:hypothetical protein [Paenibacillus castaneae]NIK77348.1 hypothetical protein [Paenibacillus castaneae]
MGREAAVKRLMCCRSAADGVRSGIGEANVLQKCITWSAELRMSS